MNDFDGPDVQVSDLMLVKTDLYNRLIMLRIKIQSRISTLYHYKEGTKKVARAVRTHLLFPLIKTRNDVDTLIEMLQDSKRVKHETYNGRVVVGFFQRYKTAIVVCEAQYDYIQRISNKKLRGE